MGQGGRGLLRVGAASARVAPLLHGLLHGPLLLHAQQRPEVRHEHRLAQHLRQLLGRYTGALQPWRQGRAPAWHALLRSLLFHQAIGHVHEGRHGEAARLLEDCAATAVASRSYCKGSTELIPAS